MHNAFFLLDGNARLAYLAALPLLAMLGSLCSSLILIAFKWCIIGRFTSGDHPFFSAAFTAWQALTNLLLALGWHIELWAGSAVCNWLWKAWGARVGDGALLDTFPRSEGAATLLPPNR